MVETPSGKSAKTENFPVGSFLLSKAHRPHVMRFYNYARAIDDIADNPTLPAANKISRLDAFGHAAAKGSKDPNLITAQDMHISLQQTGITVQHCHDLISAFKQDALQSRYESWDALMDYCLRSAAPVGRYLLDLHGEDKALYPASDALCNALQVINHLQDVADDLDEMDRVYVPQDWMRTAGTHTKAIMAPSASPALRAVFDQMLQGTEDLLAQSRTLAAAMQSRRLSAETRIIQKIAETLTQRLYVLDPIAQRVSLSKPAAIIVATQGLLGL